MIETLCTAHVEHIGLNHKKIHKVRSICIGTSIIAIMVLVALPLAFIKEIDIVPLRLFVSTIAN